MRTIYIQKDQFGLKYKNETGSPSWKPFPDSVTDVASISKFFESGGDKPSAGKYDPVKLNFSDEKLKPAAYYNVNKDRRFASVNFDINKRVLIDSKDVGTDLEIHDILRPRCKFELEEDLTKLDDLEDQVKLLRRKASPEALSELHKTLATDEAVGLFLSNHAKQYHNAKAVVSFEG